MDRPAIKRFLIAAAMLPLIGAAAGVPPLRAARWSVPGQLAKVLTTEPGECLAAAMDSPTAQRIAIGRAAFRAPLLLGGQAARAGLSCNACHRGGHGNPAFMFPGLSGDPGTADVTSSIMSSHRGDGVFNPKPIPDLSGPKSRLKVDQDAASQQLEHFIHGLVTQEFDGPEPTPATITGLAAYVRALSPNHCGAQVALDLDHDLARVDEALRTARAVAASGDGETARLMVSSARSTLGLIDERYQQTPARRATAGLDGAATDLAAIERRLAEDPAAAVKLIDRWLGNTERWRGPLRAAQAHSLYSRANVFPRR
ncbi:hypothetical protein [Novosphingobium lentum]|uniref:hypothetical protein n=1 Tax=Novosphingobium lentum TaxID=145287 RepID=UPI0008343C5B|nr:hypothetical protein [Novosphingobium lentum]